MISATSKFDLRFRPIETEDKLETQPVTYEEYLRLDLDEERKRSLAEEIVDQINDILSERAPREKLIRQFRNQYSQVMRSTSWPWPNAFNLNVPITPKALDTAMSETISVFEETEPKWTIQPPPNEDAQETVEFQEKVLDAYENMFPHTKTNPKIPFDAFLLGAGWEACMFRREVIPVIEKRTWRSKGQFVEEFPDHWQEHRDIAGKLEAGQVVTRICEYQQEIVRTAVSEHVEFEDAIVPLNTDGLLGMQLTPLSARRVWKRWSEIEQMEKQGDYDEGVSEKLLHEPVMGSDGYVGAGSYNADKMQEDFECYEVRYHMRLNDKLIWAFCTIAVSHCLILNAIRYPYFHGRNYLIPYYIQKTEKGIYQPGLGDKLKSLNISANAILNHILNAGMLATMQTFKIRKNTDAARAMHEHKWFPGSHMFLTNMDDIQDMVTQPKTELTALINFFGVLIQMADEATGINSNLSGKPDPGDPNAPGNKTAMLLRMSQKKLKNYIMTLSQSYGESGYQKLRLIEQFVPAKKIAAIMGVDESEAQEKMRASLPIMTHSTTFDFDRLFQQQEDASWLQLLAQEPLIVEYPSRRIKLLKMIAESSTTEWPKRLDKILPSDEELKQMDPQQGQQEQGGSNVLEEIKQRAKSKALQMGMDEQKAETVANRTAQVALQKAQGGNGRQPGGARAV